MRAHSLVAAALVVAGSAAAAPARTTCTRGSIDATAWTVVDFDYHASYVFTTPAHQNSAGTVSFGVRNPAVAYTAQCSATSTQLQDFFYGNFPYRCTLPAGAGDEVAFTFSRASGELRINHTWHCAAEGSRFRASGAANLTLACDDRETKNDQWKLGQKYSRRDFTCQRLTVRVPFAEKSGVA